MFEIAGLCGLIPIWIGMQCGCQDVVAVFQIDLYSSSCWRVEGGLAHPEQQLELLLPQFQEACEP